jgi:leucyl aminopeptidase
VTAVFLDPAASAIPIWLVTEAGLAGWLQSQSASTAAWVRGAGFTGAAGKHLLIPGEAGGLAGVAVGVAESFDLWCLADLPRALPPGPYRLAAPPPPDQANGLALGWALGAYEFSRYRAPPKTPAASLAWPEGCDRPQVERAAAAITLARDLVNIPAGDMGPAELAAAAETVAARGGGTCRVIAGDELLAQNWPLVHAVGRASARPPHLADIAWGPAEAPKVTLVGKGVCFDSGGLDIKTSANMALMKKDMGGAAIVLGLAQMIMQAGLRLRLRVLIPAVENAVSGSAFRPGDVIRSRKGTTVEIGNTDAEGRLILADALTEADNDHPDLLIDCATLTGAARVALGPDLPALYSDDDKLADDLLRLGKAVGDPLWRLPLHSGYRQMLDSKVADINNAGEGTFAGSITAALFLKEFVGRTTGWAHLDLYAWNAKARPGRPVGGEASALRALYALLAERYGA